jgi:HlyD family secretion protein
MKMTIHISNSTGFKLGGVVLIAVLGGAGLAAYRGMHHEETHAIKLWGNIELDEVQIAFKSSGRLMERTVTEGDPVKKGMVLARLDRDQLIQQRNREQAGLASAHAMLAQAEAGAKWQGETLVADLDLRRAELHSADVHLRELKNGSRPQEIQEAKATVEVAEAEFNRSQKDWERAQTLYKNEDITTSQFDQFRSRAESAAATLKQAQERCAMVVAGPRAETIDAATAQVERAQAGMKSGMANELEVARRRAEIVARQAEIERARAQIALIDSQLAETVAISPIDGIVLVKSADVGEVLAPGTTVVTVADIGHPWLRAYISESDLGRVKLGSQAWLKTDSFPGKTYSGRVTFINSAAEFTPKQIQTSEERIKLVYRIKIQAEDPHHELKSNMPAEAEIPTEE